MIALLDGLPLMVRRSGRAVGFRRDWLRTALRRAAARAGLEKWWPAVDLSAGICLYLEQSYELNVIGLGDLETLVRRALCDLGHEEVARAFGSPPPGDQLLLNF